MQNKDTFQIDNFIFKRCIGYSTIMNRIGELAARINADFAGKNPVFIITMKGAIFFAMELLKSVVVSHTVDTISAKSYIHAMQSSGKVEIKHDNTDWTGKDIIIIEDIVDTGLTIMRLTEEISKQKPNSIKIVTLVKKPMGDKLGINIDYWGFEMRQDDFIIGFGLDYKEYGRNLNGIYVLEKNNAHIIPL